MCGIAAALIPGRGVEAGMLARALTAMAERGPDGAGSWVSPLGSVGLAHARLAIVDRHGGAQPLHSEDGNVVAVVNGELYDGSTWRKFLHERGHVLRTRSDSELVVHLYEELGDDFVTRLRGEFAFVLWDAGRERLLAARDRFGVKPLLYAQADGQLLIASSCRALFAMGVEPRWSRAAVGRALAMQYTFPTETLFDGIAVLEPGACLTATTKAPRPTVRRYVERRWPEPCQGSVDALATELRSTLEEAVRARLEADVPVAFHLSGGLDSTAVVALARPHVARAPCFTLTFEDAAYDELAIARATTRELSAELHEVRAHAADLAEVWPQAITACEGFAINGHAAAKWLLNQAVHRAGYRVTLTGEGADEMFGGYPHFVADLEGEAGLASAHRASVGIMLPSGAGLSTESLRQRLGAVPTFLAAKASIGARLSSLLRPDVAQALARRDVYAELGESLPQDLYRGRRPVDVSMQLWTDIALPVYLLRSLGDGLEMAHSVEGRLPFLDQKVCALATRLPVELKIKQGVEKWLLREALRDVVPAAVLARRKHPLMAPPLSSSPPMRARLLDEAPVAASMFDTAKVREVVSRTATMTSDERQAWDPALLTVASVCALQQTLGLGDFR